MVAGPAVSVMGGLYGNKTDFAERLASFSLAYSILMRRKDMISDN